MKKILIAASGAALFASVIAAPAFAADATSTAAKNALNIPCMQSALDKRDTAVSASVTAYASSVNTAISSRTSALKTAWTLTAAKDRRSAIRSAWSAYRTSIDMARVSFKKAKSSAWNTFYADRKACGPQHAVEDSTTQSVDNTL